LPVFTGLLLQDHQDNCDMTTSFLCPNETFSEYEAWLFNNPFSPHTKRVFRSQVFHFLAFLRHRDPAGVAVLNNPQERDQAVQAYKNHVQTYLKPASINCVVTALNHFFEFTGVGSTNLSRVYCPPVSRRTLSQDEQEKILTSVKSCHSCKHRAIFTLIFFTGIKIGDCAALNLQDLVLGTGDPYIILSGARVPLPRHVAEELSNWLDERNAMGSQSPALFLNRSGGRISRNGIDLVVRKIGQRSRIELSAQLLRRTYFQRLAHDYIKPSDHRAAMLH
jgi:site-specific recombinase XerC